MKVVFLSISTFINTTYDISLDSQISLLPLGFSLHLLACFFVFLSGQKKENPKTKKSLPAVSKCINLAPDRQEEIRAKLLSFGQPVDSFLDIRSLFPLKGAIC